ncbi:MAG: SIP domain-containing protein [Pseudomonadota bacterium]
MAQIELAARHRAVIQSKAVEAIADLIRIAESNGYTPSHAGDQVTIRAPLGEVVFQGGGDRAEVTFASENPAKLQLLKDLYAGRFAKLGMSDTLAWDPVGQTTPLNQVVARVAEKTRISPNFMRLRLAGDFSAYAMPGAGLHFRLLFGPDGAPLPYLDERGLTVWPEGVSAWHRPPYTVRAIAEDGSWIDVDIVLHDGGRVTDWVMDVEPGAEIALHGPNGGGQPKAGWLGLIGDETALPVVARMVEAAPEGTKGTAIFLVRDPADQQPIATLSDIEIRWEAMDAKADITPVVHSLSPPGTDRYIFFAGERAQASRVREVFKDMGLAKGEAKAASYWSLAEDKPKTAPKAEGAMLYSNAPQDTDIETQAKSLLRNSALAMLASGETPAFFPMASDMVGAPVVASDTLKGGDAVSLVLMDGHTALRLAGTLEPAKDGSAAHARFMARHPDHTAPTFRVELASIQLHSGGEAHDIAPDNLLAPYDEQLAQMERGAVDHMNDDHLDAVKSYAETLLNAPEGDWKLASMDHDGLDLVNGNQARRLWFTPPLSAPGDIKQRLIDLAIAART